MRVGGKLVWLASFLGIVAMLAALGLVLVGRKRILAEKDFLFYGLYSTALKGYRADNEGAFPRPRLGEDGFVLPLEGLHPKYIDLPRKYVANTRMRQDHELHENKARPFPFALDGYIYLGYALHDERQGQLLLSAIMKDFEEGGESGAVPVPVEIGDGTCGSDMIVPLFTPELEAALSAYCADSTRQLASIPLLIERPDRPQGEPRTLLVMYADGHFHEGPYPGTFPLSSSFISRLLEVEAALRKSKE